MKRTQEYHQHTDYNREPGGLRRLDFIVSEIRRSFPAPPVNVSILEVGCGAGNIARPLAFLGYQITALDMEERAIRELQKKNTSDNLKAVAVGFDAYEYNGKYDVIIMSEVLEHTSRPVTALQKAKSLLRDQGIIIMTVPNGYSSEEIIRRFLLTHPWLISLKRYFKQRLPDRDLQSPSDSPHVQFWTYNGIKRLVAAAGLKIVKTKASASVVKEGYYLLGRWFIKRGSNAFNSLDRLDNTLANMEPLSLASGWMMVLRK